MEITASMYLIVLPMVFLAALIDSISGGGGLISLPAYTMAGLNYDFASGNNKFSSTFGTLMATVRYAKAKKILWLPALCAIVGALPGSYLGTVTAMHLGSEIMSVFMVIAIPVLGVFVALRKNEPKAPRAFTKGSYVLCALVGLAIGFYDGFFGPATGTFLIILFVHIFGLDDVTASGTAKVPNLMSNIAALTSLFIAGDVLWLLGLPAGLCSMAGAALGSRLTIRKGSKFIRGMMLIVLILLLVKMITDMLQ